MAIEQDGIACARNTGTAGTWTSKSIRGDLRCAAHTVSYVVKVQEGAAYKFGTMVITGLSVNAEKRLRDPGDSRRGIFDKRQFEDLLTKLRRTKKKSLVSCRCTTIPLGIGCRPTRPKAWSMCCWILSSGSSTIERRE